MSKRNLLDSDDEAPQLHVKAEKVKKEKPVKKEKNEEDDGFITLKVNTEFAKKYKEKKKAEELTRLKEALGSDTSSSESESEDEDGELLSKKIEDEFYKIIPMIAQKDKRIYDPKANFFPSDEENEEDDAKPKKEKKKDKALHVSDYLRERLLTKGAENAEKSDEEGAPAPVKSFAQEEVELKAAFWKSVHEMEDGADEARDDLLKRRKRSKDDVEKEEADFTAWRAEQDKKRKSQPVSELQTLERFWRSQDLDPNEKFLRDYVLNHRWMDKDDDDAVPAYEDIIKEDEEDGKALEKAENFEATYNFRHEEPGATQIPSFPRNIETSMRRTDDKRKLRRETKKQRKDEEKLKREEEKKRLKALQREVIQKKLSLVEQIAGESKVASVLEDSDIEGDFDPEKYDAKMKKLFGDDYYDAEGADEEKPVFPDDESMHEIEKAEADPKAAEEELKRLREQLKAKKAEIKKDVEAYYKLDYEDVVGGQQVRFRYIPVQAASYGLAVDDILAMEDKELNQVVSLKKLAPYRHNQGLPAAGAGSSLNEAPKKKKNKPRRRHNKLARAAAADATTVPAAAAAPKEKGEAKKPKEDGRKEKKEK